MSLFPFFPTCSFGWHRPRRRQFCSDGGLCAEEWHLLASLDRFYCFPWCGRTCHRCLNRRFVLHFHRKAVGCKSLRPRSWAQICCLSLLFYCAGCSLEHPWATSLGQESSQGYLGAFVPRLDCQPSRCWSYLQAISRLDWTGLLGSRQLPETRVVSVERLQRYPSNLARLHPWSRAVSQRYDLWLEGHVAIMESKTVGWKIWGSSPSGLISCLSWRLDHLRGHHYYRYSSAWSFATLLEMRACLLSPVSSFVVQATACPFYLKACPEEARLGDSASSFDPTCAWPVTMSAISHVQQMSFCLRPDCLELRFGPLWFPPCD